ncbi:glycoside hydrolase family 2 TIM barrel-domain containing protein [Clostridium carnis]
MISNHKILINNSWLYKDNESNEYEIVNIPHTNKEIPYNYFKEKTYQFISQYKKNIFIKGNGKRLFLKFDGVMTSFKLFINNIIIGEYKGGYIPHFIEITEYIKYDEENEIYLQVDSTEREDIPPFGGVIDYLTFGGIYRDVYLYELNNIFIENILYDYKVSNIKYDVGDVYISPRILINNNSKSENYKLEFNINNEVITYHIEVKQGLEWYELDGVKLKNINLWSLENKHLYNASCKITNDENILDSNIIKLGFRELKIEENGVYLNNKKIKIFGLNRHQSYPYVGYAMPKRVQEKDAEILKEELALNLVRTSHYPQSPHFLNKCDEIGLLVLEEIPGWQFVSKREDWRGQVISNIETMILRDYNHPSIISWGVRINESSDDEELYKKTNDLARSIDKSRKTCGIRFIEKSQLLEDIYTMNDFIHWGEEIILRDRETVTGLKKKVPYLVTEFCGHIYPTKKFDQEERLIEHSLRHARVLSKSRESEEYLGAIGWCAFDYNTHFDFGSGDRICYHGVMDMFRIPKMAASIYKSQEDPDKKIVLDPLTYWSRGERNRGLIFPVYVCTNCDEIELKFNGKTINRFKRDDNNLEENLKSLKYPPIKVQGNVGDWGAKWTAAEFIGYLKGKKVIEKSFSADPVVFNLEVIIDDYALNGNEFDATRVVVKAVDDKNNILPYATGFITVDTIGDIEVIGPKGVSLIGGSIGFWIKTLGKFNDSRATIKISSSFGISKEINIKIK